jgi:hypothetical protein
VQGREAMNGKLPTSINTPIYIILDTLSANAIHYGSKEKEYCGIRVKRQGYKKKRKKK